MQPKTLLQMAGVTVKPSALSAAAVVVVDAQREFVDGAIPLVGIAPALEETARLLTRARKNSTPVVHIVHEGRPGGAFAPGSPGAEIAAPAAPLAGETIITKKLPNAFAGTNLADHLRQIDRREIILAGFMTHMCLEATARAALDLGLKATVVAAATATRDLPDPIGGEAVPAAQVKRNALAALSDRFATIAPTADAIPD